MLYDLLLVLFGLFLGMGIERDIIGPRRRSAQLKNCQRDSNGHGPEPLPIAEIKADEGSRGSR